MEIPQEITTAIMGLIGALLGWLTRWLSTRNGINKMEKENEKLKTIVTEYDQAAREAIRSARKPKPPQDPLKAEGG